MDDDWGYPHFGKPHETSISIVYHLQYHLGSCHGTQLRPPAMEDASSRISRIIRMAALEKEYMIFRPHFCRFSMSSKPEKIPGHGDG